MMPPPLAVNGARQAVPRAGVTVQRGAESADVFTFGHIEAVAKGVYLSDVHLVRQLPKHAQLFRRRISAAHRTREHVSNLLQQQV